MNRNRFKFDYVIVGSGLAGLYSAVLASKNSSVAIITKSIIELSNSYWAQGGIAAAIGEDDSTELHFQDTINAGRGLCSKQAVEILVEEGRDRILELIDMGMKFDEKDGKINLGLEGGHSKRRVLHAAGDATGREIVNFISKFVMNNKNITIFENTLVHNLLVKDDVCFGVHAYNFINHEKFTITGNSTFIATGGASAIYLRTTNPHTAIGEGISLAYNANTEIESMEFIQFHPTSFYDESGETFLISEAVRGEGAYLINHNEERFLQNKYKLNELAPRDVIAEAIIDEMNLSNKQNVFLDLRHLDTVKIKNRFSNIYNEASKFGVDITKDLVPVAPAAHYMIGGIKTDLYGETNIKNLYAVGETASTGVHGANRLASNSLLECLVFSKRAVDHSLKNHHNEKLLYLLPEIDFYINPDNEFKYNAIKQDIARIMMKEAGIIKTEDSLKNTIRFLNKLLEENIFDNGEYYMSRISNLIDNCLLITKAALLRKESRGCNNRIDFPTEDEKFRFTIIQQRNKDNKYIGVI